MHSIPQRHRVVSRDPAISNILEGHTESVLLQNRRTFPWIQLTGATLEFITVLIFVFYVNRWIYGRNRHGQNAEEHPFQAEPSAEQHPSGQDEEYEPIVPRLLSAPEAPSRDRSLFATEHEVLQRNQK
jgi:hypothetical protein